jgi:hypothetical protein
MLVVGGIGIAAAAAREAALSADATVGRPERRNGMFAAAIAVVVFVVALRGGKSWWNTEEDQFRRHLRQGAWPDLVADVRVDGAERILRLEVGREFFKHNKNSPLIPDHGKLMHLFLVRDGGRDGFAHLHPVRKDGYTFEVAVPPLPEGRYAIFCDLTFEGGVCSTATNSIVLPAAPSARESAKAAVERDPDDSWAERTVATGTPVFRLPDGEQVVWKSQTPPRVKQDASLRFAVTDRSGQPLALEPYMGMLCHAAVLRSDGSVFAHLHPAGNFSMAAQSFFETKLLKEAGTAAEPAPVAGAVDHSMHHGHEAAVVSSVYLPYEFPEPGDYRVWVQFKNAGRILTAVFDARVER